MPPVAVVDLVGEDAPVAVVCVPVDAHEPQEAFGPNPEQVRLAVDVEEALLLSLTLTLHQRPDLRHSGLLDAAPQRLIDGTAGCGPSQLVAPERESRLSLLDETTEAAREEGIDVPHLHAIDLADLDAVDLEAVGRRDVDGVDEAEEGREKWDRRLLDLDDAVGADKHTPDQSENVTPLQALHLLKGVVVTAECQLEFVGQSDIESDFAHGRLLVATVSFRDCVAFCECSDHHIGSHSYEHPTVNRKRVRCSEL